MNDIINIITTVGFPICASIYVFMYSNKLTDNFRKDIKEIQSEHKEEMQHVTKALNNNTRVLEILCERLGKGKEE